MATLPDLQPRSFAPLDLDDFDEAYPPLPLAVRSAAAPSAVAAYRSPRPGALRAYRGAILLAIGCAAAVALTWLAGQEVLRGVRDGAAWLIAHADDRGRAIATVLFASVGAFGFVAAWGRTTHPRRAVRLADGRGRMAVDELAGALRLDLLARADIREAEVRIENRHRRGIRVAARVLVTRDARIDDVLDAVDEAALALGDRVGVPLAETPLIDVRYDELDLRAGRA